MRAVQLQRQHLWMLVGCNHDNVNDHLLAARNSTDPGTNPEFNRNLQRHGVLELQRWVLRVYRSVRGMRPQQQQLWVLSRHNNVNDHLLAARNSTDPGTNP